MFSPGTFIDRYELVCHVGDGGMAHVWAARRHGPHGSDKLVAIKVIHSRFADDAMFRRMFIDEARIVCSLEHRNVAHVFELGETDSLLYLVMEYVDGDSLFSLIAPDRTVPLPIALRIAADACAGLHAAHDLVDVSGRARNVVHRDVAPQNVLLGVNGDVKLIDFGVAHARDRTAEATNAEWVKGKARYMAPEQARREALGPYTDVFGVGATLFRMLAGRAPYAAEDDVATMQALSRRLAPLHSLPPGIPSRVADVIHRAIAPNAATRFQNTRELGAALESLLATEPPADVARWVSSNLSQKARDRRASIQSQPKARPAHHLAAAPVAVGHPGSLPPRPAADDSGAPGFMDVGALIARANENPEADAPRAADEPIEAKAVRAERPKAAAPKSGRNAAVKVGVIALGVVVFLVAIVLYLPVLARERAMATAREAGIELTVDRVGVGFGGVSLRDATATIPSIRGVTAKMQEIHVGLQGRDVRVLGLDLTLSGRRTELEKGLSTFMAENRKRLAGKTETAHHLSIVSARLTWDDPTGTRILAGDIGAEIDSHGVGVEEVKGNVGRFDVTSSAKTFGPWSCNFERSATNARVRVMFDPPVPDGPNAIALWAKDAPTQLTVKVPRTTFVNLGVKPADLGLPGSDSSDVQISLNAFLSDVGRSEFTLDAGLWGIRPAGYPGTMDVHVEASGSAPLGKPFDLSKTTVTAGPFTAHLTGTVTPHDGNLRLDALFKTVPMACDRLVSAEAKRMGTWAATLEALGEATRALKVTGTVNASGTLKFDTASPGAAAVSWSAKETCGVSIFGM